MNGRGGLIGQSPRAEWMSVWHSPLASTRTSTWPGPGSGTGRSSITSGLSNALTTAVFIAASLLDCQWNVIVAAAAGPAKEKAERKGRKGRQARVPGDVVACPLPDRHSYSDTCP